MDPESERPPTDEAANRRDPSDGSPRGNAAEGSQRASDLPPGSESEFPGEDPEARQQRKRLEKVLRDTVKRTLEKGIATGIGTISRTDSTIRELVGDVKLPREVAGYVFSQIDETKNILVRVVAKEVRDFLQATDFAQEVQKALTSLSFEIKTEIRFIPNETGGADPEVKTKVRPRKSTNPPPMDDE